MTIAEAIKILQGLETRNPGAKLHISTRKGSWWRFGFTAMEDNGDGTVSYLETSPESKAGCDIQVND